MRTSVPIKNWRQFDRRVRKNDARLLANLSHFSDAILVAGCQRSGTTAVTRILRDAIQMACPAFTRDDELDAALILNGVIKFDASTRCCFQTTYVNDHFLEYFEHHNYRLIWIIRNPEAVVQSMLHNWRRGALNRLFLACGRHALDEAGRLRFKRFGTLAFSRTDMACFSYNVKTAQVHEIAASLGRERLYILDYDELISRRDVLLPDVFSFVSAHYDARFLQMLRMRSGPGQKRLNESTRRHIRETCEYEYNRAVNLAKSWH